MYRYGREIQRRCHLFFFFFVCVEYFCVCMRVMRTSETDRRKSRGKECDEKGKRDCAAAADGGSPRHYGDSEGGNGVLPRGARGTMNPFLAVPCERVNEQADSRVRANERTNGPSGTATPHMRLYLTLVVLSRFHEISGGGGDFPAG